MNRAWTRGNDMSPIAKGFIFAGIGVGIGLIMGLGVLWPLFDLSPGGIAGWTIAWVLFGGLFGFFTAWKDVYSFEPRAIWAFILDISWSSINTVTGLIWMIYCAVKGTFTQPTADTKKRGIIMFANAALPGATASTLGTVMGGSWLIHEAVHVQQARIFGPFYWPTYLVSYALNMLMRFLTGRFRDPHWEAYARVVMEDWAYRATWDDLDVKVAPSVLWFFLALLNALALGVAVAPIPGVGALPSLFGLDLIPWWIGLIVILLYALVRSFFRRGDEAGGWQLVYA